MMSQSNIYLSVAKVAEHFGVSASTIWRWTRTPGGRFPRPVKLSAGCTRWRASDVMAFASASADLPPSEAREVA